MRRLIAFTGLAVLVTALAFAAPVQAQGDADATTDGSGGSAFDDVSWFAWGELAAPFGDWSDEAGMGFGGGLGALLPHSEKINFRGEIGYIKYGAEDFEDFELSYSMIPILALAEYMTQPDNPLYFVGGLGIILRKFDAEYTGTDSRFNVDFDGSDTEIGLVAGGGYRVNEQFNFEARLHLISDSSVITFGGMYLF